MSGAPSRPTPAEIQAARGATLPDLLAPGLDVLFCGINPSLYSGATGFHFARPGNRFWPALHGAGFTDRLLQPWEQTQLLEYGLGLTNLVARATAAADELSSGELRHGREELVRKLERYRPRFLAVLGITAFRTAFGDKGARGGPQPGPQGETRIWVLPNPSGRNAHFRLEGLVEVFAELARALDPVV